MKAKELIEILSLNPEAEILTVHTQYDGNSNISTLENPQVITDGDTFAIVADDYYDKLSILQYMATYDVTSLEIKRLAKSKDACIYLD